MSAKIIDGKALAARIRNDVSNTTAQLKTKSISPGLAVVLVGSDPASQVYVRNKAKACEQAGIYSEVITLADTIPESQLLDTITDLNHNPHIHGILVQLPLPDHIDAAKVIEHIDPYKDVDGFHPYNVGLLTIGKPLFRPCTPYGILKMLDAENINLWGAEAVIIGASNIVGKPMALLMQSAGATVTICNSKTRDLAAHTRRADVLVVAMGKPQAIDGSMIKLGASVIDVGINRLSSGQLVGDVDFDSARQVAGAITPVPGGVGPMTIAMLLVNTLEAAQRLTAKRKIHA